MGQINFKAVAVKIGEDESVYYIPRLVYYSTIDSAELIELASKDGSISKSVIEQALEAILLQIEELMLNGHSLQLDKLGTLRVSIMAKSQAEADDVSLEDVKRVKVHFSPSSDLKKKIDSIQMRLTENEYKSTGN